MTTEQIAAFGIILASLILFVWGRWRYDLVAMAALIVSVIMGIVPADEAFEGFNVPPWDRGCSSDYQPIVARSGAIGAVSNAIGKLPA